MELLVILLFVVGYLAITLEHSIKIDKLIPALLMMAVCWAVVSLGHLDVFDIDIENQQLIPSHIKEVLLHHLGKTAEILVFLMGAMTIVEIIDHFDGFASLKRFIRTRDKKKLLWILSILAFILSAIIDNLTATIVLITILRKIMSSREDRLWYAGMIIVSANAGGAWSPIGDVTTTMLWIEDKVTTLMLVSKLFIPSLVCMIVPTLIAQYLPAFKGEIEIEKQHREVKENKNSFQMLVIGLLAIIFVPVFKTLTHLPPYVGMMMSLAIVATVGEILSKRAFNVGDAFDSNEHGDNLVQGALARIEMPSILFFLGILMAVAALESIGTLYNFATSLTEAIPNTDIVVMILGVASAIIDNVPLVAASMGMFPDPTDSSLWHFIAYAAGTGGSLLIIGSAAGVVAMGMERIDFFWYLRKISWLALIGYLTGAATFYFFFHN